MENEQFNKYPSPIRTSLFERFSRLAGRVVLATGVSVTGTLATEITHNADAANSQAVANETAVAYPGEDPGDYKCGTDIGETVCIYGVPNGHGDIENKSKLTPTTTDLTASLALKYGVIQSPNADKPVTDCIPPGLTDVCPPVTEKPNDTLVWQYPQTPMSSYYETDGDIWLMVDANREGAFWGLGTYQHQTSTCRLTGENDEHFHYGAQQFAGDPSSDFSGFATSATPEDPYVFLRVAAYCPKLENTTVKNLNVTPAVVEIGKTDRLTGDLMRRVITEKFLGSSLMSLAGNGVLMDEVDQKAKVTWNFSRASLGKPWTGRLTVTDPELGRQINFTESAIVIRSNITEQIGGRVTGQELVAGKSQQETVNWNMAAVSGGTI